MLILKYNFLFVALIFSGHHNFLNIAMENILGKRKIKLKIKIPKKL